MRALVLAGAGGSFSAGHDIKEAAFNPRYRANIETVEGRVRQERDLFVRPIELLQSLPIATVCRVQGHCMAAALDADDALRMGLVNWVVPGAELDDKVQSVLDELLSVPPEAIALSKLSMRFMENRRGRMDTEAYHFLGHQLSHHTTDAVELLRRRVSELEQRLREKSDQG